MVGERGIEHCVDCKQGALEKCVMWRALPVPAFGMVESNRVKVATIGLNPVSSEFVDERSEWKNKEERLPVVMDYGLESRGELNGDARSYALAKRRMYFLESKRESLPWFGKMQGVMSALRQGWFYNKGTAVHVDLVACATWQSWGDLSPSNQQSLMKQCLPKFKATLDELHYRVVVLLDGRTASEWVMKQCGAESVVEQQLEASEKLTVWKGMVGTGNGLHRFYGWSTPVNRIRNAIGLVRWLQQELKTRR